MVEYQNRSTMVPFSQAGIPVGEHGKNPPCPTGVIYGPDHQIRFLHPGHPRRRINHVCTIGVGRIPTGVYNTTLPVPGIPHFREFAISRLPPNAPSAARAAARDFATLPLLPPRLEESTGGGGVTGEGPTHRDSRARTGVLQV